MMGKWLATMCTAALLAGCGGAPKRIDDGTSGGGEEAEPDDEGGGDADMIPPEKLDEVNAVFVRKEDVVARCYAKALESKAIDMNKKGYVTVGLRVSPGGKPTNVRVLESTLSSDAVEGCIVDTMSGWSFPKLPTHLDTSYTYKFERDY